MFCEKNTQNVLTVQKMHDILCVRNAQGGTKMFPEILKKQRKLLELSQEQVANLVGIERSYYTKIENGLRPSVKVAQAIGKVLKIEWTIFFSENCAKNAQSKTA